MATTVLSGAAFGAAMAAAGFHDPAVVIAQLKLENWHMMQAFLAATATSAVGYAVLESMGVVKIPPRNSSPLGLFSRYDGNAVGGGLLGVGMAMSGSCPGTLFAQLAAGVGTGLYALQGAIVGGILWAGPVSRLVSRLREKRRVGPEPGVVSTQLGLSKSSTLSMLVMACVVVVAVTSVYTPSLSRPTRISGAVGGLLIGGAQLVSLLLRKTMLGVSGSYEEAGNYFWWMVQGAKTRPASWKNMLFALGVAAGAWGLLRMPFASAVGSTAHEVAPVLAATGGMLMALGARIAGGCTSGHGISGISLLSTSSFVTIASALALGGLVAPMFHPGTIVAH